MDRVYIIAEIAQGHEGDLLRAKTFVSLAKNVGADAVKFQIFRTDELATPQNADYLLFKKFEFTRDEWREIIDCGERAGIDVFADIFGIGTLRWLKDTGIKGFKVHSTDIKNYPLLRELGGTIKKSIYLSTGGSTLDEIEKALTFLKGNEVVLLSGFQAFPNEPEDIEFDKIDFLRQRFGKEVGYADHIDPQDVFLAVSIPAMAVLKGARVVEKHLTTDRAEKLEDYVSALNPDEFRDMVSLIRAVERFPVTGASYALSPREEKYRAYAKKIPLAKNDLPKGHEITEEDILLLRTGESPSEILDFDFLVGKRTREDIHRLTPFTNTNTE